MDDKLAGEAAKLATQAQDLATNLKGVAQQITDMAAQGTLAAARRPHAVRLAAHHLRAGLLRRLLRGVAGDAGAAFAADGRHQRRLLGDHRRRAAGGRPEGPRARRSCSAPSPWRWPPSTSSAASSSRTACCRCSRRSTGQEVGGDDRMITQELAAYGYLIAAICFIMALRGLQLARDLAPGQPVRHRRHGGGDRRHRRHPGRGLALADRRRPGRSAARSARWSRCASR